MLIVETKVKKSRLHGKGLFAGQEIKKGQVIWRFNPLIDRRFPRRKLSQLPPSIQKYIKYYSYLNDRDEFVLCGDDARYMNHSDNPNTEDKATFWDRLRGKEGISMATKDIRKGEEITSRYLCFDNKGKPKHI